MMGSVIPRGPVPGPTDIAIGDDQLGWYGETTTTDLITGDALAALINLTAGSGRASTSPWLKFAYQGKIMFVAKVPYRQQITFIAINGVNAATGDRIVTIKGTRYRLRLMTGSTGVGTGVAGGEWNALMYRVAAGAQVPAEDKWANYTAAALGVGSGTASSTWCKDTVTSGQQIVRGTGDITGIQALASNTGTTVMGWRPVLEVI